MIEKSKPQALSVQGQQAFTAAPIEITAASAAINPEFIRLPRPKQLDPRTGLGRSFLNTLILPSKLNGYRPPVRSISLRRPGHKFGVRLIDYKSLMDWIRSHASE